MIMIFSEILSGIFSATEYDMDYSHKLFDTSQIISIDIVMDQEQWNTMLENAQSEGYYECDVVINGTTFQKVGIRPKGNTSLSSIASDPDNNRYSFKLEFDHYVDDQTCWGLDKLALNNNYADTTNMKEAIIYDMYQYLGADASLYNYAKISVNGEYWGVYLALEAVEDSFITRNFGNQTGHLYKPDGMNMGNKDREEGGNEGMKMPQFNGNMQRPENMQKPESAEDFSEGKAEFDMSSFKEMHGNRGGGGFGSGGANLNYADDELDSYSTIWEGAVTDSTEDDHKKVVTALKNISEGNNLEKYMDVDNLVKYMAVHSFAVNEDSLSGSMAHNYYLYEHNGRLNIIPWDYNLAFGGMNSRNASDVVNDPIDSPFSATDFFDTLLENEEYSELYHEYYRKLVEEYVYSGRFEAVYNRIRVQIDELVKTDPNTMYSYEEYVAGAEMLYNTVMLRATSVKGQLDGTIPSTDEEQQTDSSKLIDSSAIDLSVMGEFMGGGMHRESRENSQEASEGNNEADFARPAFNPEDNVTDNPSAENTADYCNILIASSLVMIFGFLFVILIKRKNF